MPKCGWRFRETQKGGRCGHGRKSDGATGRATVRLGAGTQTLWGLTDHLKDFELLLWIERHSGLLRRRVQGSCFKRNIGLCEEAEVG